MNRKQKSKINNSEDLMTKPCNSKLKLTSKVTNKKKIQEPLVRQTINLTDNHTIFHSSVLHNTTAVFNESLQYHTYINDKLNPSLQFQTSKRVTVFNCNNKNINEKNQTNKHKHIGTRSTSQKFLTANSRRHSKTKASTFENIHKIKIVPIRNIRSNSDSNGPNTSLINVVSSNMYTSINLNPLNYTNYTYNSTFNESHIIVILHNNSYLHYFYFILFHFYYIVSLLLTIGTIYYICAYMRKKRRERNRASIFMLNRRMMRHKTIRMTVETAKRN